MALVDVPLPGSTAQSMEQRFTFDQIASVYRDARPDYPEALVNDVISYAGMRPNDSILEIGCGTGQATKSFAARGYSILAMDPGPEMVRAARRRASQTLARSRTDRDDVRGMAVKTGSVPADHRCAVVALGLPRGAVCESREGTFARFTGGVRTCSGGTARTLTRTIQADIPASHRSLGSAAGSLVPALWSIEII